MLDNMKPKDKSLVVFEWALKIDGVAVQHEGRARADHATARGLQLPDELAAAISISALRKVASRAAEACRMEMGSSRMGLNPKKSRD